MTPSQRVLITGSAGRIGRAAVKALTAQGHIVWGFDRSLTPGLPASQCVVTSLADVQALEQAMRQVDCLIHLAAAPDDSNFPRRLPPDDGDNFLSELVPSNIAGPYHVMEAARKAGVKRVILASTGQVIDGHLRQGNIPVTMSSLPKPRYLYACTKVFLEALGQVYATHHGMSVLAVRLGWCPRDLKQVSEIHQSSLAQDVYLSPVDAGAFFLRSVECPLWQGYVMLYATSKPLQQIQYDLEPAKKLIGFVPEQSWPTGADDFMN
jgi:uronate dehydrogenase